MEETTFKDNNDFLNLLKRVEVPPEIIAALSEHLKPDFYKNLTVTSQKK